MLLSGLGGKAKGSLDYRLDPSTPLKQPVGAPAFKQPAVVQILKSSVTNEQQMDVQCSYITTPLQSVGNVPHISCMLHACCTNTPTVTVIFLEFGGRLVFRETRAFASVLCLSFTNTVVMLVLIGHGLTVLPVAVWPLIIKKKRKKE